MQRFLIYPAAISVSIPFLSYTVFVDMYRKYRARYDLDDKEVPVNKDIQRKFHEVMNELNIKKDFRERIKLFNVYDINTYHAGTVWTKYGSIIGVPVNFEYKDIENITEDTISIRTIQVDWNTKAAKEFRNSLIFSENAQKFALARELIMVTNNQPFIKGINYFLDVLILLLCYFTLQSKFKKHIRNKRRLNLYVGAVVFMCIAMIYSNYRLNLDDQLEINDKLVTLGDKYIEGGIEYYEQLLKRNKALKQLFGNTSKYYITPTGDEISWFSSGKLKFSKQLDYFKAKMENRQLV